MNAISHLISIALIGGGVAGFAAISGDLVKNEEVAVPLNVLGINRSPYGEVIAMAMQGPIDTYFHAVIAKGHVCEDPDHCNHDHSDHDHSDYGEEVAVRGNAGFNDRLRHFIEEMGEGLEQRTNPRGASDAHKFYLRRGIEDKLKFAYQLDPGHYGNYNSYSLFLTEPQLGTRPELTPSAAKLAQDTINYCLSQRTDPRKALTAAAAAGNVIELMFNDRQVHPENPNYTTDQMREVLQVMDQAIGLYSHLANEWVNDGQWENLSELRLAEVEERFNFVLKIRETFGQAIRRLEDLPPEGSAFLEDR